MKLVLLGPPGAGKGTAAAKLTEKFALTHLSTGDMLRQAIRSGTEVGLKAKAFVDAGALVPSALVIEMVDERLKADDIKGGYMLDGFPRTVEQAEALEEIAAPDAVIDIAVEDAFLVKRLTGRRVCAQCKGTFHITRLADETLCPDCGGALTHRSDDQEDTIRRRLAVYHEETEPLIDYYRGKGKLMTVDGAGTPEAVLELILKALEKRV